MNHTPIVVATIALQQHLPFTVLKHLQICIGVPLATFLLLQQHLPFTVLKHYEIFFIEVNL